jgi:hypothetical protein
VHDVLVRHGEPTSPAPISAQCRLRRKRAAGLYESVQSSVGLGRRPRNEKVFAVDALDAVDAGELWLYDSAF